MPALIKTPRETLASPRNPMCSMMTFPAQAMVCLHSAADRSKVLHDLHESHCFLPPFPTSVVLSTWNSSVLAPPHG